MAVSEDTLSKCSEHLSAYKSACEDHPDLKAFDAKLQQRTNKVIDSLTVEAKTGSVSQHAVHMEVSKHLLDVTQSVANFITEGEHDVWNNKALRSLVNGYFDNTIKTLKIFNTIENCVDNAEMGQLLIQEAVAEFDKESAEKDLGEKKKKYEKTMKKLKEFKALGDPFDSQVLTTQFELIKKQQESLLEEVCEAKKKIHEEITNLEKESLIWNVVFGTAAAITLIVSIALIATGVGAVAGIGALSISLISVGWAVAYSILEAKKDALKKHLEGLKKLENVASLVEIGIKTNEEATETVSTLVNGLEDRIHTMLKLVDNAIENDDHEADTKLVLEKIREKVNKLTEKIKEVGETVANQSKLIAEARLNVLRKINQSSKHESI